MSAFVIVEMPNKHYSTQLKTHQIFKYRKVLTLSQKRQTVLAKLELPHFIVFTAIHSVHIVDYSSRFRKQSSVKHSNIWVELFWDSVVNKLNHWFLVVSSFGSPNKVLSLSQWNTASPGHGVSNNTTARIKVRPSFIVYTFGRCISPHRDVDMWGVFEWAVLGGRGRVITYIKNISLGLRL